MARVQTSAERSGRAAHDICLLAVTKTVPVDRIDEALKAGVTDIGESRIQEAAEKKVFTTPGSVRRHLVGSLQRNKARKAVQLFDLIQSVDGDRLAEFLDRIADEAGKTQDCLMELKISDEPSKSGVPQDKVADFIENFKKYRHLNLRGIMTIGSFGVSPDATRVLFRKTKDIFDQHRSLFGEKPILSMGMTDDFEIAIEEGSNMIRIGRGLFGDR